MNEQLEVLLDIARLLDARGIAYMVSGSTAMNFYARPRMTRDIDLVVELDPLNVHPLVLALSGNYYVDEGIVREAVLNRSMFNAIHNETLTKVDFIVRKEEPYRLVEFKRRRCVTLGAASITAVAPEDLILSKLLWSEQSVSEQQENDVRNLLDSAVIDHEYLRDWARELGILDRLSAIIQL